MTKAEMGNDAAWYLICIEIISKYVGRDRYNEALQLLDISEQMLTQVSLETRQELDSRLVNSGKNTT